MLGERWCEDSAGFFDVTVDCNFIWTFTRNVAERNFELVVPGNRAHGLVMFQSDAEGDPDQTRFLGIPLYSKSPDQATVKSIADAAIFEKQYRPDQDAIRVPLRHGSSHTFELSSYEPRNLPDAGVPENYCIGTIVQTYDLEPLTGTGGSSTGPQRPDIRVEGVITALWDIKLTGKAVAGKKRGFLSQKNHLKRG